MFLQVSICPHGGGVCGFIWGACVVLFGGACMVLFGGCAWFYLEGHAWFYLGGMHGFIRGGMHGFIWGGGMHGFFSLFGYNERRSMSRRYASYWNAFLSSFFFNRQEVENVGIKGFYRGKKSYLQLGLT